MYKYVQATGELFHDDNHLAFGYSGYGVGKNNPDFESNGSNDTDDTWGPLPCGMYTIQPAVDSPTKGPVMLRLVPDASNQMFDRGDFEIHGDSALHPGKASHGCTIFSRSTRETVAAAVLAGDNRLQVVAYPTT